MSFGYEGDPWGWAQDDGWAAPALQGLGDLGGFAYSPNLGPVGSGAAYFPGPVDQDAAALAYLGYPATAPGGGVSQEDDMENSTGAWDPAFRKVVLDFQADQDLTMDGWIGPATRTRIKQLVDAKNAAPSPPAVVPPAVPPFVPPAVVPPAVVPPAVVPPAVVPPPPQPGGQPEKAISPYLIPATAGVALALVVGVLALRRKRGGPGK